MGALNTAALVRFGLRPNTARNSCKLAKLCSAFSYAHYLYCLFSFKVMTFCFSLPLYGFGSLPDDDRDMSFTVCTLAGEEDGMLHVGSLLGDVSRARRTLWEARRQTLVQ